MAEIYLAIVPDGADPSRQFAIKVIHQQNADDPDFVRMLVDEARLAVQLKHPNIVTTFDLGLENDQYYIVMEMIEGADLFRLQQRAADQRLSLPIPLAAYIAREVAKGLDYAHRLRDTDGHPLQVVHRDISPQNVLLSFDGAVKITDFGIAKAARRAAQTQAGIIKGKYYYMSPEQAAGQFIDGRTDIFAAGILLYEMLIGEMLYYDDNVERLLQAVRKADIPPVSQRRTDTPPALERILMKALAKSPSDRYQTAGEYSQALDTYLRRFAPRFGAADVAAFLEKLVGEKVRRRAMHEPTAALSVSAEALSRSAAEPEDHTVGMSTEQIRQLGIRDENSLIFQPKAQLAALLQGGSQSFEAPASPPPEPLAKRANDEEAQEENQIKTTQRQLANNKLLRRGSSSGTMEVAVPSLHAAGSSTEGVSPVEPSDEVPAEGGDAARRAPRVTLRSHVPRAPRPSGSTPSEVFRGIEPELEEELLAGAAAVAPQPYPLSGPRRTLTSWPRHQPLSDPQASAEVTVPRAEVPPELLAALLPRPEERESVAKPSGATAPPPRRPAPVDQSSKVELLQSDLAFSDAAHVPVEPNVELSQSDASFSDLQLDVESSKAGQSPVPPSPSAGDSESSLDAISAESTHHHLKPPPRRPELEPEPVPIPPEQLAALPAPPRLWPYWVSGIGAALLSAGLTWYLTGPGAHRGNPTGGGPDLLPAAHSDTTLSLPDTAIPEVEPPPAGETAPALDPTPVPRGGEASGQLVLTSKPEGAEVFINKKSVGVTPLTLTDLATEKDFKVELRLSGYEKLRKRVKWKGKTSLELVLPLVPSGESGGTQTDDGEGSKSGPDKGGSGAAPGGEN